MSNFNNEKPYGGSSRLQDGGLKGTTDTDYFYFFCPVCIDENIMRILDYDVIELTAENQYNSEFKIKAKKGFTFAFKLYCEICNHTDFVKLSNTGWQAGQLKNKSA